MPSRSRQLVLAAGAAAALLGVAATPAAAATPTPKERAAIVAAARAVQDGATADSLRLTADRAWARLVWREGPVEGPGEEMLLHRGKRGAWTVTSTVNVGDSPLTQCTDLPQAALRQLYARPSLKCPRLPAPRKASAAVQRRLRAALLAAPPSLVYGTERTNATLEQAWIAGTDRTWAVAGVTFPDTGYVALFHLTKGRWAMAAAIRGDELQGGSRVPFWTVVDLAGRGGYAACAARSAAGAPKG